MSWRGGRRPAPVAWLLALALALAAASPGPAATPASPGLPRIALLSIGTDPSQPPTPQWQAFFEGLRALGWIEGRNLLVERRFAAGRAERIPGFASELVRLGVDVIVATGLRENQAIRRATTTIPVVMVVVDDPVEAGFVQSLARPGGNFTGVTFSTPGIGAKHVQLLREAVPFLTRAEIVASRRQRPAFLEEMQAAAGALGVALSPPTLLREVAELEPVLARVAQERTSGLIFPNDAFTTVLHRQAIVALVAKHKVPAIYASREQVEAGGLLAYGPSYPERFRQAATFVHKILKGAKPSDLPVEQPTRFELTVNLDTARAMGLTLPPSLLERADQVIAR